MKPVARALSLPLSTGNPGLDILTNVADAPIVSARWLWKLHNNSSNSEATTP